MMRPIKSSLTVVAIIGIILAIVLIRVSSEGIELKQSSEDLSRKLFLQESQTNFMNYYSIYNSIEYKIDNGKITWVLQKINNELRTKSFAGKKERESQEIIINTNDALITGLKNNTVSKDKIKELLDISMSEYRELTMHLGIISDFK